MRMVGHTDGRTVSKYRLSKLTPVEKRRLIRALGISNAESASVYHESAVAIRRLVSDVRALRGARSGTIGASPRETSICLALLLLSLFGFFFREA